MNKKEKATSKDTEVKKKQVKGGGAFPYFSHKPVLFTVLCTSR